MITNRELLMEDYVAIARRRIAVVVVPTLAAALIGFLISYAFTPKYTSKALLLVEGQVVPTGYVNPIVTERVSSRMIILQQSVLSRSRLEPLVNRLGLARKGKSVDDVIDDIRTNLLVTPFHKEKGAGGNAEDTADVPGFNVAYTADNPRDAQQVCAEITSLLLAENLEVREQVAQTTTDFLSRQLDQAKHNLDDMDGKLSRFKIEHFGRLPGDMDANMKMLAALNSQLDATTQNISRLQQDKSYTEMLLDQDLSAWKASQAAPIYPTLRQQLIKLQDQLVLLQTRYTDDFPDVVKTKHEIEELQAKLKEMNREADQSDGARQATVPRDAAILEPEEIRRLRDQIYRTDRQIEHTTDAQKRLQDRIDTFQSRFALKPEIEDEYKQLTRDSATAHNIYDQLLTNKSTAEIQTEMERSQEGEQLKLLDPASLPNKPSFPVRWQVASYGCGAGLVLGIAIAFWLEVQDKALRDEADIKAALELPLLVSLPWLGVDVIESG
jgi:polysaccharide chain length determinant protein (PEP-CTERM system associated)